MQTDYDFFDGNASWLVDTSPNTHGPKHYTGRRECRHGYAPGDLPHLVVVHTAESLPDWTPPDYGAENVAAYASSTHRDVSWHATVDSDSAIRMLPDTYTGWHVRGYNSCSVGVEIATQAHQWTNAPTEWVEAIVDRAARVVADWCQRHNIPAQRITAAGATGRGIVAHSDLDPSRRFDPGSAFPWDQFLTRVQHHLGAPIGVAVIGEPEATVGQAIEWATTNAARRGSTYTAETITEIVRTYYTVGTECGVRADLALAQAAKETGFWSYGGDVDASQWNFAGIGATGGVPGHTFPTIDAGTRAHLLRMRMYAIDDPNGYDETVLVRPLPSAHWGRYPTIQHFDGVWAYPGRGYGDSIVNHYLTPLIDTVAPPVSEPAGPFTTDEIAQVRRMLDWWYTNRQAA